MKQINDGTVIFSSYTPRITEWDTARSAEAIRNPNGSVSIRISSETERDDKEHKSHTISAEEAEHFGRALLCMEDSGFDAVIGRAAAWEEEI